MLEVIRGKYEKNYVLWLEFNDGTSGFVDLEKELWGPVFEPLRQIEQFKNFHVSKVLHTIVWDNNADFAPEFLKEKIVN